MNNYVYVGEIVNTHGIKGELRIKSDFEKKSLAFKIGNTLYLGNNYYPEVIKTYRVHKIYDMVTFDNYTNINEVLKYLHMAVYVKRNTLKLKNDQYILSDLINFEVIDDNKKIGKVIDYVYNKSNTLLVVSGIKTFYIPMEADYIQSISLDNKVINTSKAKELII